MNKNTSKEFYKSVFFKDDRLPFVEARFVLDSDYHYNEHFHETLSIGAVEHGQVAYLHKNIECILKPDALAVINPNVVHACNPIENESRTYHMIYLDPLWCKGVQETIFGELKTFIAIPQVDIKDKELFDKYIDLNYLLLNKEVFYLEKEEVLYSFLVELFTKYCEKTPTTNSVDIDCNNIINIAQEYIKENLHKNLTVKDISDYLDVSEFYFIRLFKQYSHITPHSFLLNQKIEMAKKLLSTNMDISQVAYELGFSDQSHLNRVFKHYVAATPYEYKNSILKK